MRAYEPADADAVLALNAQCVPEVGEMDAEKLNYFASNASFLAVEENESGEILGFLVGLDEEARDYTSNNYAWFRERHESFAYVDRIAIDEPARGQGVGQDFYRAAEAWAYGTGKSVLAAEVNTVPDNPASHRFHQAFGFVEVGRAKPYGGEEEVAYYEKKL